MTRPGRRLVSGPCRAHGAPPRDDGGPPSDDGAASALVLALVAVLVAGAATFALATGTLDARARARAAADLAALAGAQAIALPAGLVRDARLGDETTRACAVAAATATANRAELTGCAADAAGVVTVSARVGTPVGPVEAAARAGPRPSGP